MFALAHPRTCPVPRLITFGGLAVRNGTLINGVANPRSRLAILAVIAVSGDRGIRREKLAALFWPDSDEERGRNTLRQALFIMRRDLGVGDITIGVADLRLNQDVLTADVSDFDAHIRAGNFEAAASLYQGPFLDGVLSRESPEFERWVEEQRTRLSSEYGRALERAAADARQRGDHRTAADWWEKRARHDPLSGRVARLYMEALVAAGDREQAIRHAALHATLVKQELEAEPDPDVEAFAEHLREVAESPRATGTFAEPARASTAAQQHLTVPRDIEPPVPDHNPPRRQLSRAIRAAVLVAAAAGVVLSTRLLLAKGPPIQQGLVAVADFDNRTGDSTLNAVTRLSSAGIVEVLTHSGRGGVLDLREGSSTSPLNVESEARRSPAEYLVRGSLERRGDSLTMIAQIVEARSGAIRIQVEPITVPSTLRERIADEVRERLGGAVVALGDTVFPVWRTGRSRPPRYSAYHEFMQGMDALVNQGMETAVQHFVKSMQLDPDFAQAKLWYMEQAIGVEAESLRVDSVRAALLAQRATLVPYDQAATDRQLAFLDGRLEDVYTASRQMVVLAPDAPDVKMLLAQASYATRRFHEALELLHAVKKAPVGVGALNQRRNWDLWAHRLLGDVDAGIAEWRQEVAENPDQVEVCEAGFALLAAAGREAAVDSLLVACDRLPDARPNTDRHLQTAGRNYRMNGHNSAAERAFRRALALRSALAATGGRPKFGVAGLHIELGEWKEAYDILRQIPAPNGEARVFLGVAAAHVGDTATAREVIRWTDRQVERGGAEMDRAFIELALGQRDQALASLRAAIALGVAPSWNSWYVRPELLPLRGDPRFEEMIRPIR